MQDDSRKMVPELNGNSIRNPRAPSSEPATSLISQYDSPNDDAELEGSPQQKRPRLDSGSSSRVVIRSLSADLVLSPRSKESAMDSKEPDPKPAPQTPSKITLHVKSETQASNLATNGHLDANGIDDMEADAGPLAGLGHQAQDSPQNDSSNGGPATPTSSKSSSKGKDDDAPGEAGSSPSVPIEIADPEDINVGISALDTIEIEGEDYDLVYRFIHDFPYSGITQKPVQTCRQILKHLDSESDLDKDLVSFFQEWLEKQDQLFKGSAMNYWPELFYNNTSLWEHVGLIFGKLFQRGNPYGPGYEVSAVRRDILPLVISYINLVSRMVLLDCDMLHAQSPSSATTRPIMSTIHLIQLRNLLTVDNKFLKCLVECYHMEPGRIRQVLATRFLAHQLAGVPALRRLFKLCVERIHEGAEVVNAVVACLQVVQNALNIGYQESLATAKLSNYKEDYAKQAADMFLTLDVRLREGLDKQNDPLSCDHRREIFVGMSQLLATVMDLDVPETRRLYRKVVDDGEVLDVAAARSITAIVWKIKLLKRYIREGRMELRVMGVETMAAELVAFFNKYRQHSTYEIRSNDIPPVLLRVAQALVEEQVMEYIFGVSSHPQIIHRCGNIIGFLVVTNNFTEDKADLLWDTLVTSQDPRIASAIWATLGFITKTPGLTLIHEDVYLCQKMLQDPFPAIGWDASEFFRVLCAKHKDHFGDPAWDNESRYTMIMLCISMIRRSQSVASTAATRQVRQEAVLTIASLAPYADLELRCKIYQECHKNIVEGGPNESVYIQAVYFLMKYHDDSEYLSEELNLTRLVMESLCRVVDEAKRASPPLDLDRFKEKEDIENRLQLVLELLKTGPSAPADTSENFWNHLVGADALDNSAREFAWKVMCARISFSYREEGRDVTDKWLDGFYENYLPKLRPENFVSPFMGFVDKIARSRIRGLEPGAAQGTNGVLDLPGIELVWRVMLTTPDETGEDQAMKFLAGVYLDYDQIEKLSNDKLENNHVSLARRCISRMDEAYAFIRSNSNGNADRMDIDEPEKHVFEQRAFSRIIQFLMMLRNFIRLRPELYCRSPSPAMDLDTSEDEEMLGEPLTIAYQVHSQSKSAATPGTLKIGDLQTRKDLHQRISRLSGLAKFKLIWWGRFIDLLDNPMQTLRDYEASKKGQILVREDPSDPMANIQNASSQAKTMLERELVSEFKTLYKFMDAEDRVSSCTYDLLKMFEPHKSICLLVAAESTNPSEIFPDGQIYRVYYSLRCLESLLTQTARAENGGKQFAHHGIRLLEWLLISRPIPEDPNARPKYLFIFQTAIPMFSKCLRQLTGSESALFSDGARVVDRIRQVLQLFSLSPTNIQVAGELYELMISVVLACPDCWAAFRDSFELQELHTSLLLSNPNPVIRQTIVHTVKNKMDQFPTASQTSQSDFTKYYWEIVSALIPTAVNYSLFCQSLFVLAVEAFRHRFSSKPELDESELALLNNYFLKWTDLLLTYEKNEFVGREDENHVIHGLSNMLSECFVLLKGRDELSIESLPESLWTTFLFPPTLSEDQYYSQACEVPLLDTKTRGGVYRLLKTLTLDNGDDAFANVAEWTSTVAQDVEDPGRWDVDRTRLLRSKSGYLGLRNLGNTCYMNSLLTQLFMSPEFRRFIISQPNDAARQPILRELQVLFSNMQNSFGPWGDTMQLVRHIRTYNGDNINIAEQMDVDEFCNLLFEQLEDQLAAVSAQKRLANFFGGTLVYQIKSKECDHVSEREEPYFNVPCVIQGKTNLAESLQAFVEGDVMQGDNKYKCEKCGGKLVDAVQRQCLKEIPNNMILHLKRFEFDIGLQRRSKINDYFEFPMWIDMSPYTFKHLANPDEPIEEDIFDLVGVLVHKGQAEHGHYISYIRTRPSSDMRGATWLLFDDSEVTEFDPNDIPETCYGGISEMEKNGFHIQSSVKVYSAYMLFYQRRTVLKNNQENLMEAVGAQVPDILEQQINAENARSLHSYCLFGAAHQAFVKDICLKLTAISHEDHTQHRNQDLIIHAVFQHIWRVSCRQKDQPDYTELLDTLKEVASECPYCAHLMVVWFARHIHELRDMLVRTNIPKIRHQMQAFVIALMRSLRGTALYGINVDQDAIEDDVEQGEGALFIMLEVLNQIGRNDLHHIIRGFDEFFGILNQIGRLGKHECWVIINKDFMTLALEYLIMHHEGKLGRKYNRVLAMMEKRQVNFNNVGELLSLLLVHVNFQKVWSHAGCRLDLLEQGAQKLPMAAAERNMMAVSDADGIIWMMRLFEKWDPQREGKHFALAEILATVIVGEASLSIDRGLTQICKTMKDGIETLAPYYAEIYIRLAPVFCEHCPVLQFVKTIVRAVNKVLIDNDAQSGSNVVEFYDRLAKMQNVNFPSPDEGTGSFYRDAVSHSQVYGPILLAWEDNMVKYQCQALLRDVVLGHPPMADPNAEEPTEIEKIRTRHVRLLFNACFNKAKMCLESDYNKGFLQPIMSVMKECTAYITALHELGSNADEMKEIIQDHAMLDSYTAAQAAFEIAPPEREEDLVQSGESPPPAADGPPVVVDLADDSDAEALSEEFSECSDDDTALDGN